MILSIDNTRVSLGTRIAFAEFPGLVEAHLRKCPDTESCEKLGAELNTKLIAGSATEEEVWDFIVAVCTWGGRTGNRVRGRIAKKYNPTLALLLFKAAADVLSTSSAATTTSDLRANLEVAADAIDDIYGLATSFATKMVRFLRPEISGVLDTVVSTAGNYPLNNHSFGIYCTDCLTIASKLHDGGIVNPRNASTNWRVGDVDQAMFARFQRWA